MKTKLFFSFVLTTSISWSQSSEAILDFNNASGVIGNKGCFFHPQKDAAAGYQIPKSSNNKVLSIYEMALVMEGKDSSDQLRGFSSNRGLGDLFAGPIDDYLSGFYSKESIWLVYKSDILTHISNFSNPNYVIPEVIKKWPANGNVNLGNGSKLAPFVDVNNNSVYEPNLGDYPMIKGDAAAYVIMNDIKGENTDLFLNNGVRHNVFGAEVGMEIHVMTYQFVTNDAINNTTFFNVKAFNRGENNLHDVVFGLNTEFDLGDPSDDYIGSDSLRNMVFAYNGDDNDETNYIIGYGIHPPAVGVKFLSENASGTIGFYGDVVYPYAHPTDAFQLNNFLHGKWADGSDLLYGGMGNGIGPGATTSPSKFIFSGPTKTGNWTELTALNSPGDRRALIYDSPKDFNKGQQICFDFAVIYSDAKVEPTQQIDSLAKVADFVQAFYDNQDDFCSAYVVGIEEIKTQIEFSVSPNPTDGQLTIELLENRTLDNAMITIENSLGQIVKSQKVNDGITTKIDLSDVSNGIYILKINGSNAKKIVKN